MVISGLCRYNESTEGSDMNNGWEEVAALIMIISMVYTYKHFHTLSIPKRWASVFIVFIAFSIINSIVFGY